MLGKDITFSEDASVAEGDRDAPLMNLGRGQMFKATLLFTRGTALEHAKFLAVATPSYRPAVRLKSPPSPATRALLSSAYDIADDLELTRKDGLPCRSEAVRELAPTVGVALTAPVTLGIESLGQMPAAECVARALAAVAEQTSQLVRGIIECDSAGAASFVQ